MQAGDHFMLWTLTCGTHSARKKIILLLKLNHFYYGRYMPNGPIKSTRIVTYGRVIILPRSREEMEERPQPE
jgi:hypothetical protein